MSDNALSLKQNSKIYISGPISDIPDGNIKSFKDAQDRLTKMGYIAINPHDLNDVLRKKLQREPYYSEAMAADYAELLHCDAIYMLRGWHKSIGANREIDMAKTIALPVFFEPGN